MIVPQENTVRPTDPLDERTEYTDFFVNQIHVVEPPKGPHVSFKSFTFLDRN